MCLKERALHLCVKRYRQALEFDFKQNYQIKQMNCHVWNNLLALQVPAGSQVVPPQPLTLLTQPNLWTATEQSSRAQLGFN